MKLKDNRIRLLLVYKLICESDETHPVTMKDIAAWLDKNDISWNRKTIYEDLDAIEIMDVRFRRTEHKDFKKQYYWVEI